MTKIPAESARWQTRRASAPGITVATNAGWRRWNAGRRGSVQVHSQLMLVCRTGQSQLILVGKRLDCRSGRFQMQAVTTSCIKLTVSREVVSVRTVFSENDSIDLSTSGSFCLCPGIKISWHDAPCASGPGGGAAFLVSAGMQIESLRCIWLWHWCIGVDGKLTLPIEN